MATPQKEGVSAELVDELLAGRDPAEAFRSRALIDELKKDGADARWTQRWICILHLVRGSLAHASYRHRKPVASALKAVYRADSRMDSIPSDRGPGAGIAAGETAILHPVGSGGLIQPTRPRTRNC